MAPETFLDENDGSSFRLLLDTAPDAMVVVGATLRIVLVNVQAEKTFGYARSDLLGEPLERLLPHRYRAVHAGHMARFFENPGARPMGSGLELFGLRADGTEIPIEVSLSPVRTERGTLVSAAIRDITSRKKIEAQAKLNADRLVSAIDSIQDAFALFDASDELVVCNLAYRRIFGDWIEGPIIGKSYAELLAAWVNDIDFVDAEERARFHAERLAKRHEATATFELRTRDGRNLRVVDRRTPEGGVVKTIWDLTEDERRREELREARVAAEAGSAAKSEFLSSMSHELRTPLNAILGFAQLLQRDKKEPLSPRHRERVDRILTGGEHLLHLIEDVLDLSRVEAGKVAVSIEPVDVANVLDEIKGTLASMAAKADVRITVEMPPAGLPMISADRTRFAQILTNFGSNAIKYNRPGGTVTFAASSVRGASIRVTVRDDGLGIPIDKQDKVFQPFQRAGQETGPIEGTGIGLAITKRLAELMHGRVGFESVFGEGSSFWVDLPVDRAATRPSALPSANAFPRMDDARRGSVLYVEDNPANVTFMRDLLGAFENIELLTAATAEEGIALARARHPQVILMDINLPGMSGIDALRRLRELEDTKSIPVIALTAAASESDRRRGEAEGFHRYLTKPVKVAELEGVLESLLAR